MGKESRYMAVNQRRGLATEEFKEIRLVLGRLMKYLRYMLLSVTDRKIDRRDRLYPAKCFGPAAPP